MFLIVEASVALEQKGNWNWIACLKYRTGQTEPSIQSGFKTAPTNGAQQMIRGESIPVRCLQHLFVTPLTSARLQQSRAEWILERQYIEGKNRKSQKGKKGKGAMRLWTQEVLRHGNE